MGVCARGAAEPVLGRHTALAGLADVASRDTSFHWVNLWHCLLTIPKIPSRADLPSQGKGKREWKARTGSEEMGRKWRDEKIEDAQKEGWEGQ